jgi:hypothetical protein
MEVLLLKYNMMVQNGYAKHKRGYSPQEGKRKGGAKESNPLLPSVNQRTQISPTCTLNKSHPSSLGFDLEAQYKCM